MVEPVGDIESPVVAGIKVIDKMLANPEASTAEIDANVLWFEAQPEQKVEFLASALALIIHTDQRTWL